MSRCILSLEPQAGRMSLLTRRTLLHAGGLAMGGAGSIGLPLGGAASAAAPSRRSDTACIVFFLDGGPSHHETFDPKPEAPPEVRGEFGAIETSVPGIRISERLPLLARQAEHYALIRSLYHESPSHAPAEHQMLTGWMGTRPGTARAVIETPSLGSIVSRLGGPRRAGMPAYVAVPWSFHHAYGGSPFGAAAYLDARFEPFESGPLPNSATAKYEVPELTIPARITPSRVRARGDLLVRLDRLEKDRPSRESLRRLRAFKDQAMDMLVDSRVRRAFDLSREPEALRRRYGSHEWGQSALLARRLVEEGVTFVMLQCGVRQDWDTHKQNFPTLKNKLLPPLDRAVSALIEDLVQRGRLDKTHILVIGEFGRTPKIGQFTSNNTTDQSGRDHWPYCFSALAAGGGVKGGQVVGASDSTGAYPRERALHARDLFATMYHVLGIDHRTIFHDRQGRPIPVLKDGTPIAELL